MPEKIQSIRGMNDILPFENKDTGSSIEWQYIESVFYSILKQYGYNEIRTPILEKSELFHRSVGEVTDIVEKETYDFKDRNNESLTLRPEGTAGCIRAVIEHNMLRGQRQKLYYSGAMYRHERPQKGRYRQFYQLGVEALGFSDYAIELEVFLMTWRFWQAFGLGETLTLEINNLGSSQSREIYKQKLIEYFKAHEDQLDQDSKRRLYKNPLRILDSKNQDLRELIDQAPKLCDHIDNESRLHFEKLCLQLEKFGIPFKVNPYLVRGLDYYSHTVFEWVTDKLGAQGTVCAGGRYNSLIKQLGGPDTDAFGFALGLERILILIRQLNQFPLFNHAPHVYFISSNDKALIKSLTTAESLRNELKDSIIEVDLAIGSFKSQLKRADKLNAMFAVIIGDDELSNELLTIKPLTAKAQEVINEQTTINFNRLLKLLKH